MRRKKVFNPLKNKKKKKFLDIENLWSKKMKKQKMQWKSFGC